MSDLLQPLKPKRTAKSGNTRPLFIVTDNAVRARAELFANNVPSWVRIIADIENLDELREGDAALGVFHHPRRQATPIDRAFVRTRIRCHPLGLSPERMAKFYAWRKEQGLPSHFAVFDVGDVAALAAQQTRGNLTTMRNGGGV